MKTGSVLVALLVSGCMTNPAYIGEGPANDTGGSGGTSGTGSTGTGATGMGSSGTSGTASGGSGTGDSAGVPVQGGSGGAPAGAGAGRRFESGSCRIEVHHPLAPEFDQLAIARWDADERVFSTGTGFFRIDENGRILEMWDEDNRALIEYDAEGAVTSFTRLFNGGEDLRESWDQTNEYDDTGRLLSSNLVFRAEERSEQVGYGYESGPPAIILRQLVAPFGTSRFRYDIGYREGRPAFFDTTDTGEGMITDRRRAWYDAEGRLLETEWDTGQTGVSGIDGEPDFVEQWIYDDEGRIIRYESDFNSGGEYASTVDGVPDEVYFFEPECAGIAVLPYYLYGFPAWLFPYASTGGWRF